MARDTRKKGCYNPCCERNGKKYLYKTTDNYCTICGVPLVFVCAKCFKKIENLGPDHRLCKLCEAAASDKKEALVKQAKKIEKAAIDVFGGEAAKEVQKVVKIGVGGAEKLVKTGADAVVRVVKKK